MDNDDDSSSQAPLSRPNVNRGTFTRARRRRSILGHVSFLVRRRFPAIDGPLHDFAGRLGFALLPVPPAYYEDDLCSSHDHSFVDDDCFRRAYERAVKASKGVDHCIRWRVHILLWVAGQAAKLRGDFVECGVNTGFMSSAMLTYLDWPSLKKTLYLLDTFAGPAIEQYSDDERNEGKVEQVTELLCKGAYEMDVRSVRANFAEWQSVRIVKGAVPETLSQVESESVAFLHLDMNCAGPEVAAAEYLWPRVVLGGFVLIDDYSTAGYSTLKRAFDDFACRNGVNILSLPTGQGLMQKSP